MDKEYYKEYYRNEREHWWFRVRELIIKQRLGKICENKSLKILNIGAATGRSTEFLSEYGEVTSVEYDKDCCEFLESVLKIDVLNASITDLPFNDNTFDLVCAFDVIEHVEDDKKATEEMLRVCNKGGNIIITVPAFMSLWSAHDEINHHQRRYLKKQLQKLLDNKCVQNEYISYFNFILFIPILVIRIVSNLISSKEKKPESDFKLLNNKFFNGLLYSVFSIEKYLLKFFSLPFGVSIIYSFSKKEL